MASSAPAVVGGGLRQFMMDLAEKKKLLGGLKAKDIPKSDAFGTIISLLLVLAAGSLEKHFKTYSFKCPCSLDKQHLLINDSESLIVAPIISGLGSVNYGLACIFIPAVALFLLALLLNPKVWFLAVGFCDKSRRRKRLRLFIRPFGKAFLVAFAWIFFALLRGQYFVCAMTVELNCQPKDVKGSKEEEMWLMMSRVMAAVASLVAVGIFAVGNFILDCCFRSAYSNHMANVQEKYKTLRIKALKEFEKTTLAKLVDSQKEPKRENETVQEIQEDLKRTAQKIEAYEESREDEDLLQHYNFKHNLLNIEMGLVCEKYGKTAECQD